MKLPKFLYKKIVSHNTSLGDNAVFPPEEDFPFEYKLIKKRYSDIIDNIQSSEFNGIDVDKASTLLSQYIVECQEKEEPIKENLIKICENVIASLFDIPNETVELFCDLVKKIESKHSFRLMPESCDERQFDFEDLNDFENASKVILKRRFIDSLTLGLAYKYSSSKYFLNEIYELDNTLPPLYDKIRLLSDFLLFEQEENISDKNPKQGSCVEVELGRVGEKTVINAQGIIFPFLLNETLRGFFELFASHGLPQDNNKAEYIIKQSDFLLAEPWDLRFGVGLCDLLFGNVDNTKVLPYYFMNICSLPIDEFNTEIKEVLAKTKHGKQYCDELLMTATHDYEMDDLTNTIQLKNSEKSVIEDDYMNEEDIDSFIIENDGIDNDNNDEFIDIIKNCTSDDLYIDLNLVNGSPEHGFFNCVVSINDIDLPLYVVDLKCETIETEDGEKLYVPHIDIMPRYQHMGLGYKIFKAFVECVGSICRSEKHTRNHNEMASIYNRLNSEPNIVVDDYYDENGEIEYRVARLKIN